MLTDVSSSLTGCHDQSQVMVGNSNKCSGALVCIKIGREAIGAIATISQLRFTLFYMIKILKHLAKNEMGIIMIHFHVHLTEILRFQFC